MTNTKSQRWSIAALVIIALAASLGVSKAVQAGENLLPAVKATACFVFARAAREPEDVLAVYIKRIGKHKQHPAVVHALGYNTGLLDAYGYANTRKFGSFPASRADAATQLYKLTGCTINVKI